MALQGVFVRIVESDSRMSQLLSNRHGIETWLMDPGPYLLQRCPAKGPWQQLVARAEQFRSLADLRWTSGAPYGIAGFRNLRKGPEWTELELDFVPGVHLSGPHPQGSVASLRYAAPE